MSFLSGFVPESNHHHHTSRRRSSKRNKFMTDVICDCAYIFGISLFIMALIQLLITLLLNVKPGVNLFDVYSRNASSVVCFVLVGIYLIRWYFFNIRSSKSDKGIIFFKVIALVAASFCLIKGLLSVYYIYGQAYRGIYVLIYYFGEAVAWCTLAYYIFVYAKTKLTKNHSSSGKRYKTLTIILAIVCIAKTASAILYTLVNYRPHVFPWVFYMCDTIAWAMLTIFFTAYATSPLINMSIHKQNHEEVDEEIAKAMEKIGQKQSDSPVAPLPDHFYFRRRMSRPHHHRHRHNDNESEETRNSIPQ